MREQKLIKAEIPFKNKNEFSTREMLVIIISSIVINKYVKCIPDGLLGFNNHRFKL